MYIALNSNIIPRFQELKLFLMVSFVAQQPSWNYETKKLNYYHLIIKKLLQYYLKFGQYPPSLSNGSHDRCEHNIICNMTGDEEGFSKMSVQMSKLYCGWRQRAEEWSTSFQLVIYHHWWTLSDWIWRRMRHRSQCCGKIVGLLLVCKGL